MFKTQFMGPRFSVGADYFESSNKRPSLFERHAKRLMKSWGRQFNPRSEDGLKQTYLSTFSSLNWNKLSLSDKAAHSLSNCYACANNFLMLQKSFPLAPIYEPNSLSESACEKSFSSVQFSSEILFNLGKPIARGYCKGTQQDKHVYKKK